MFMVVRMPVGVFVNRLVKVFVIKWKSAQNQGETWSGTKSDDALKTAAG
jgi:hypothetical protein